VLGSGHGTGRDADDRQGNGACCGNTAGFIFIQGAIGSTAGTPRNNLPLCYNRVCSEHMGVFYQERNTDNWAIRALAKRRDIQQPVVNLL
jgi:hypothetical protein